jgi:hypothetical protein
VEAAEREIEVTTLSIEYSPVGVKRGPALEVG